MLPYPCRVELSSEGSKYVAISVMQGSAYESSSLEADICKQKQF